MKLKYISWIFSVAGLLLASAGNSSAQSADVKAKDRNGQTALIRAALAGNADSVKAQIAVGADVRAKDKNGETALMQAAVAGNAESVLALITAGADVKVKDRRGQTALDKTTAPEIVKLLQEAGGLRDVKKKDSNTSIAVARSTGRAMAGLLSVFAEFEHEILRERIRAGIAEARLKGKHLGRPVTVGKKAAQIRKLHRAGVSKAEIARRLDVGRTSVRRILADL